MIKYSMMLATLFAGAFMSVHHSGKSRCSIVQSPQSSCCEACVAGCDCCSGSACVCQDCLCDTVCGLEKADQAAKFVASLNCCSKEHSPCDTSSGCCLNQVVMSTATTCDCGTCDAGCACCDGGPCTCSDCCCDSCDCMK